ncbi:MAG: 4-hydroxy-3-methylbut-2-enyl diphosphate reductase [Chloroflexota bacterium]
MTVEKAPDTGFCYGVRRAIDMVRQAAREYGSAQTLGPVVHNEPVLKELEAIGVTVASRPDDLQGDTVVISSHGLSPEAEAALRRRHANVINTTCPFVHRAQTAARRLARAGFFVVVYGDADHAEVKGILGWANGRGMATLDAADITNLAKLPRRLGVVAQTTQVPERFTGFVNKLVDAAFGRDSEIWAINTICHDTRQRQAATLELAGRVDLMLVIGSRTSANTNHLARLAAGTTETHLIETAAEIQPAWLEGRKRIGVTSGASTADQTIAAVLARLEDLICGPPPLTPPDR